VQNSLGQVAYNHEPEAKLVSDPLGWDEDYFIHQQKKVAT